MQLIKFTLTNYRNIRFLELIPFPGLNVFTGQNAQGKSNLLEAIYLLAISKSYRASVEKDLVSWEGLRDGDYTVISGTIDRKTGTEEVLVGLVCHPDAHDGSFRKQVRINGVPSKSSELVGLFNAVLFTADDIQLVLGGPAMRRRYIDVMLAQGSRQYLQSLQRYHRALGQRNSLLRSFREGKSSEQEFVFWDETLCAEASIILETRHRALIGIEKLAHELFGRLMGPDYPLNVSYVGTAELQNDVTASQFQRSMAQALERSRSKERALAQTVVGPHRDDLRLRIQGLEMGRHASRGQARLAALALRLAEGAYLEEQSGESPVLLLDDVLSELDNRRRALVLEEAQRYSQVLITTADQDLIPRPILQNAHRYRIESGAITLEVENDE